MYSRKIVNAKIERYVKAGKFAPEYHTVNECLRGVSHLDNLVETDPETDKIVAVRDSHKRLEDTLTKDEVAWIDNETLLCRVDFWYFISRYVWIKNEEDRAVRMTPWKSQEIFLSIIAEMEEQWVAIMLIILKARQLGLSRIISLILLHRINFFENRNAFMASSTEDKTRLLFDMVDFVLERLPWWLKPREKFRREGKLLELYSGSGITLQHGQQGTGIARGTTPTVAHISELAEFDDPSYLIDSSLLRAMHDSPGTFLALEGTADGMNNWWHKKWNSAKANWPEGRSRLRPLFLPWFAGGLYPKAAWLRAHPVPESYERKMLPWAQAHAGMAEEYVRSTYYLNRHLGGNWFMPIEQVWYYECERESAIRENRLNKFLQEMPANDDEAFQSTNISVFDTETLVYYRDNSHRQPLVGIYGLRGPTEHLPERLQPAALMVNPNEPIIPIKCAWSTGYPIHFELVPLRFDGWSLEDEGSTIDKFYLWEKPERGMVYGLGVDTSDGIDKDRTVIEILRKGDIYGPARQVGEFASGKMNALDATPWCLALGTLFAVENLYGQIRQPRMAIECKGNGDQTQLRLRMHGWNNFHPWNDKYIDSKKMELHKFNKIGVFTNSWFRTGMLEMLIKMLRDCEIEICSPFFVKEMQSLEGDDFNQSLKAGYGGHDDRVMALGFILISLYRFDVTFAQAAHVQAYAGRKVKKEDRTLQYARWIEGPQTRTDQGIYLP